MTPVAIAQLLTLPAFAWAALWDHYTRRVPRALWLPLVPAGAAVTAVTLLRLPAGERILVAYTTVMLVLVAVAIGTSGVAGAADSKAIIALALLFPVAPALELGVVRMPLLEPSTMTFGAAILLYALPVATLYPLRLALANALEGRRDRRMASTRLVESTEVPDLDGWLTDTGIDLEVLREYLAWRGSRIQHLEHGDGWNVEAFLEADRVDAHVDPEALRTALHDVVERDVLEVSPGIPFLVPLFVGLLLALTTGNPLAVVIPA